VKLKMKWILLVFSLLMTAHAFSRDGDDAGNGGFAYKQSRKILKMATEEVLVKVEESEFPELIDYPERREILLEVLSYDALEKLPKTEHYRGGRLLSLDYKIDPNGLKVYKPFYVSFMGTLDIHLEAASEEVQKRLLHEAAHIWGYGEDRAERFALEFLSYKKSEGRHNVKWEAKEDFPTCFCQNGRHKEGSWPIKSCKKVCQDNTFGSNKLELFAKIELSLEDQFNPDITNLKGWCHNELGDGHISPDCYITVEEEFEDINLRVMPFQKSWFRVDIGILKKDKTYIAQLKSTTGVHSNKIQFRVSNGSSKINPLKIVSTNRYVCINLSGTIQGGNSHYEKMSRVNYMFATSQRPPSLPQGNDFLFCHDREIYGEIDSVLYPRLNEEKNIFSIWDQTDMRMADLDSDGRPDINNTISDMFYENSGNRLNVDIFKLFTSKEYPLSQSEYPLGYILKSFVRPETGITFCPGEDYYDESIFHKIVKKFVGVKTQALYKGERQRVLLDEPSNNIYLKANQLYKIGFYLEDGQTYVPTKEDYHTKTIFFYWPADYVNPLLRKSGQRLYRVVSEDGEFSTDKRVGCVPFDEEAAPTPPVESCSSDYQCSSLCCNSSTGTCNPHDEDNGLFCSKPVGQSCVTSDFCQKEVVKECKLYETGTGINGELTCSVRCFSKEVSGDCVNNTCRPPAVPPIPDFDPANPDCTNAIPLPN